uniref:Inositol-polyphosphate 5-phosphatase n=1 Tax=Rhabditophanes sp. KR3021 TaxID=114890 RepID=A0AC35U459_9BILA
MNDLLLLTANVGSLFEENCKIKDSWEAGLLKSINAQSAKILIIHFQEVGGKHFEQFSPFVEPLIKELFDKLTDYSSAIGFLDLEYDVCEQYTALGSVIFIRREYLNCVKIHNFSNSTFESPKNGFTVFSKNLQNVKYMIKKKFPKELWTTIKWGRKGLLHTKIEFNGEPINLVNVHLFHDDSNIACHQNPNLYSNNRANAMNYVLNYINDNKGNKESYYIFGDFNFRLNLKTFLEKITQKTLAHHISPLDEGSKINGFNLHAPVTHSCSNSSVEMTDNESKSNFTKSGRVSESICTIAAIEFRPDPCIKKSKLFDAEVVLRIEKKRFLYVDPQSLIKNWHQYLTDDHEVAMYKDLHECQISFPPTYPWSEDPDQFSNFMETRPPAWCDRILMNNFAWSKLQNVSQLSYDSVGKEYCMGDHKPVYLSFKL